MSGGVGRVVVDHYHRGRIGLLGPQRGEKTRKVRLLVPGRHDEGGLAGPGPAAAIATAARQAPQHPGAGQPAPGVEDQADPALLVAGTTQERCRLGYQNLRWAATASLRQPGTLTRRENTS